MYNAPRPHIHRPVKTPCIDCAERHIGCHASCERFKAYRAELAEEKQAAWTANASHRMAAEYEIENVKRYRR